MPISSDFLLDFTNRRIYNVGSTRYTVNQLYSYVMDQMDNAGNMDDTIPMSAQTPTEYSLINSWFMDDDSYGYLYGGSIRTIGWDAAVGSNAQPIYQLTLSGTGYTNAIAGDIGKTVNASATGVLVAYNNTTRKWWVRRLTSGTATFTGAVTITGGTGACSGGVTASVTGEDIWANFYTLGTIVAGGIVVLAQVQSGTPQVYTAYPGYTSGHIDQLVKVTVANTDVDSKNITAFIRDLGNLYDNFTSTATATGGRNPIPLATSVDTNDNSLGGSVVGCTISFGSTNVDVDGDGNAEAYDVTIDGGGNSCLNVYRWLKYITRSASGLSTYLTASATNGKFYRYANAGYAESKQSPLATFAGGKIFGARGVVITNVSDANNRSLIDSAGITRNPPVTVTLTVSGLAVSDRVLVARSTGVGSVSVNKSQFTVATATNGAGTFTVNEAVGNDIPTTGVVRIADDRYTYTSLNRGTKTFTISGTLSQTYTGGTGVYVPLIDDIVPSGTTLSSVPLTYVSDINFVYRVRHYASGAGNSILPFENSGILSSTDQTVSAIRTVDPVAT